MVTGKLSSLIFAKFLIEKFGRASGLKMNVSKSKGFFFNRRQVHTVSSLPFSHWNENLIILGIPYGSEQFIDSFWKQKILDLNKEVGYFRSFHYHTLQAKAIISKSKLMPKISYVGSVLPLPNLTKEKINDVMLGYVVPHKRTFLKIENLAAKKTLGGIGLANIVLHCNIMLIRNVMLYIKMREERESLNDDQYFLEYNIGHQLCNMWNLPYQHNTPHCFAPNDFYRYILDIIKTLKAI